MTTLFIYAPATAHHQPNHPENPARATATWQLLAERGLLADLHQLPPQAATTRQLLQTHHPFMVELVEQASLRGGGQLDQDTYATAASFELASLAAGSAARGVDAILNGEARNGYIFSRPPGHHAERRHPGGFCLFNNIAVAAQHGRYHHQIRRTLIIDIDVHHGNGTQNIFYLEPDVLFISVHQHGHFFYPNSGAAEEIGQMRGTGTTMNIPLPPGVGDHGYDRLFTELIAPRARQFQPELLLVSAGYDAHWADPLASATLSLTGYARLAQNLVQLAEELCHGRVLFVQEGGYLQQSLSYGVLNTLHALLGRDDILDPLGSYDHPEAQITDLISTLHKLHLIK